MRVVSVHSDADHDIVAFEWSRGGTGTLTIRRDAGLITALTIRFD